jgi:hypothetical protein
MKVERTFPEALRHGEIQKVFSNIYFVKGTVAMSRPLPMRFSRNMTIIKEDEELTLINSVRLNDAGLKQLEELGKVKNVIRLAAFHGMDDPFYKKRYNAKVWSINAPYTSKVKKKDEPEEIYFNPDIVLNDSTVLPLKNAKLIIFKSCTPSEAILLLQRENGIVISGDCLENWSRTDEYFSFFSKIIMKMMGFIKPYNIGPVWLKLATPDANEIKSILELDFEHVLPAHGEPVINRAKELYRSAINNL